MRMMFSELPSMEILEGSKVHGRGDVVLRKISEVEKSGDKEHQDRVAE